MKKKSAISPMQRSLKALREQNWIAAITEHYNFFAHIRQDLWGLCDILCLKKGKMLAVQTTTGANLAARKIKVLANPNYPLLKSTGCGIELHGWSLKGKRGKRKTWQCRIVKM